MKKDETANSLPAGAGNDVGGSAAEQGGWGSPVVRQGVWIGVATGLYGISFGALAVASGLTAWQALALSALLFSGASQFALVGVLAAGGSGPAALAASALLGLRNGFYGLQVARLLEVADWPAWKKALAAQLTIDESTAVALAQPDAPRARQGFWATGWAVFGFWNAMTLLGAWLGNALGDPRRWGLDAAAAAAFAALLWPRLDTHRARVTAVAAAVIALLAVPLAPPGIPILLGALAAAAAGWQPAGMRAQA
ncbi:MAG: AzlC family ABC transporter permease [Ottowia sp.]